MESFPLLRESPALNRVSMTTQVRSTLLLGSFCAVLLRCGAAGAQPAGFIERTWYDGDRPVKVWMAPDEVAVTFEPERVPASGSEAERLVRRSEPTAVLEKRVDGVHYFRVTDAHAPADHAAVLRSDAAVRFASPVFYPGDRQPDTRMALTGEIIVRFRSSVSEAQLAAFEAQHRVAMVKALDFSPQTYVFDARAVTDSLELCNQLYLAGQVAFAFPNWIKTATPR